MADKTIYFVQLIENYPCLYNNTLQEYSRKDVTEKAWAEISRNMDWAVADCKEKWKNIRNGFVRSLKPSPSGSSSKTKKLYYLHDIMQFVLPYVRPVQHVKNTGNIRKPEFNEEPTQRNEDDCETNDNDFEPNDNDTEKTTEQHKDEAAQTKRRQETTSVNKKAGKKKVRTEKDDVDTAVLNYISEKRANKTTANDREMFLLTLLPDVNKLTDSNLRQFKINTLLFLEELLTRQEQAPVASHPQITQISPWSTPHSRVSYTSPPGPSPITTSSMSPQCTPNHPGYELTHLQNMSQSANSANTNTNTFWERTNLP